MASFAKDLPGKMVAIWFPISAFIALGLEHSVANMFIIPLGSTPPARAARTTRAARAARPRRPRAPPARAAPHAPAHSNSPSAHPRLAARVYTPRPRAGRHARMPCSPRSPSP